MEAGEKKRNAKYIKNAHTFAFTETRKTLGLAPGVSHFTISLICREHAENQESPSFGGRRSPIIDPPHSEIGHDRVKD